MDFYKFLVDYVQKRQAEREAKGKGLRGLLNLVSGSVGSLLGSLSALALPYLGLSLKAVLPIATSVVALFTLFSILAANVWIWPKLQSWLAESDDDFNYMLFLRERLQERLEEIRKSKISTKTKQIWEEAAYLDYFKKIDSIEQQVMLSRTRRRHHTRVVTELREVDSELVRCLAEISEQHEELETVSNSQQGKEVLAPS